MNEHPIRATILAAVAMGSTSLALFGLLRFGWWWFATIGMVVAVAGMMALARRWVVWLPGPVGLVTVAFYTTAVCTPWTAFGLIIPTPASLRQFGDQMIRAADKMASEPPFGPQPEVYLPLILLGFGLATLVAVALAADLGWPAMAAGMAAGPWILLALIRPGVPFPAAAVSAVAVAALLACGGRKIGRTSAPGWSAKTVVAGLAGVLVAALVAVPIIQGSRVWGSQRQAFVDVAEGLGYDDVAGATFDLGLRLDRNLRRQPNAVQLRTWATQADDGQTSDGGERLRVGTIDQFDGTSWRPPTSSWSPVESGDLLWPGPPPELVDGWLPPTGLTVKVEQFQDAYGRVPLTDGPRQLAGLDGLTYDRGNDSASLVDGLTRGQEYRLDTYQLDRSILAGSSVDVNAAGLPYLALPASSHAADWQALAHDLTADAPTDHSKIEALLDYFRGPDSTFHYTLNVPLPITDDVVWEFIQRQTGYCAHYATAFTMMARSLGLPTRLAVGFAEGTATADGSRVIRGDDAHAWPEVYFGGLGWVPFEPTPGFGGNPPGPVVLPEPTPTTEPTPTEPTPTESTPNPEGSDVPTPEPPPAAQPAGGGDGVNAGWRGLLLGLLGIGGAAVGYHLWQRARQRASLETVWRAFQQRAWRWGLATPGQTVREVAASLAPRYPGRGLLLAELAALVEQSRYAPPWEVSAVIDVQARRLRDAIGRAARPRQTRQRLGDPGGD